MGGLDKIILFLSCLIYYVQGLARVDPLVDTELGLIRGLTSPDGDYSLFMGIPYATVNASNPFGPSIPHPGFTETFDAFDDTAICPQREEFNGTITGNLDCLHLNIYVPNVATSRNRLPVIVWIYGGSFSIGFAGRYLYDPVYLIRHEVILVTLNYRLGPYGFMCLDIPEVPGNQGLKDQLTALRWIKRNIQAFGGDHNQITLAGNSAGGISVDFQYLYSNENLFNKIIMESGVSLSSRGISNSNIDDTLQLCEYLGLTTDNVNEAIAYLATINTDLVIAASATIGVSFWPCIERSFDNVEPFITEHPFNVEVTRADSLPILVGFNSDEGGGFHANRPSEYFETLTNIFRNYLRSTFTFEEEYVEKMEKNIRQFYIGDESFSEDVRLGFTDFSADSTFVYPTNRMIQKYLHSFDGASPIYYYMFSYVGDRNFVRRRSNITEGGALHADEISYLFDVSIFEETPTPEDQLIIDRITTLWTNFVNDPTPEVTDLLPIIWPAITENTLSCLNIDTDLEVLLRPLNTRMAYWDLFFKLNGRYQRGLTVDTL